MEFSLTTGIVGALAGTLVLFTGLLYLRTLPSRPAGLDFWTAAFGLNAARYIACLAAPHLGRPAMTFIAESLQVAIAILLLAGVLAFLGRRADLRAVAGVVAAATLWAGLTTFVRDDFLLRSVPLYLLSGVAMIATGVILLRARGRADTGYAITALAFLLWGVHKLDYPLLRPVEWFAPIGFILAQVFAMAAALGLLIVALQRLQSNVETTERALERSYEVQRAVSDILRLSLSDRPLKAQLEAALDVILAISWLSRDPRGGIVLAEDGRPGAMTPVARRNLPEAVIEAWAAGPDGHYAVPIRSGDALRGALIVCPPERSGGPARETEALETIAGTLAALIDRARADEAVRRNKARFRDAAEVASDWFWETDAGMRFVHLSDSFRQRTGLDPDRVIGRSWDHWGAGRTDPASWEAQLRTIAAREPFRNFEYTFRTGTGAVVCWSISGKPLSDEEGRFAGYRGTARDISEDKQMRLALAEAKKQAEVANRAKTEFLANMSHELRTPLNAIIGFSEIMVGRVFGDLPQRYHAYASDIVDSGRHLLSIINDILDISKIESGRFHLNDDRVSLSDAAASCIHIVRERAREAELRLEVAIPDDLPAVRADERAIKQILLNLVSNAIKFTRPGGRVVVRAVRNGADGGLSIAVEDTGIGIPRRHIETVFSPFEQIESAMSRRAEGTGLGLPLVRSLAELHGGSVEIVSAPGEGTTVTVHLPAERMLKAPAEAEAPAAAAS